MKTVLFVATSSNVNSGGGRTRMVDMAREAQEHGFRVYILCFVYATQWLSNPIRLWHGRAQLATESVCPVFYLPIFPFGRWICITKINDWLASTLLAWLARWLHAALLIGLGTKAGYLSTQARKVYSSLKVVSDIQGAISQEYRYEHGDSASHAFIDYFEHKEATTLSDSDGLIFVSRAMQQYYEEYHSCSFLSAYILPCVARTNFSLDWGQRQVLRSEYGLLERFIICYVGAAESYQLPDMMCRLFKQIKAEFPQAFFLIYSFQVGAFEASLRQEGISASDYKITSVSHDQIFSHLQIGDVGLLLRDSSLVNRVASPLKFGEYCTSGLPVITTPYVGDYSLLVKEKSLGAWVEPSVSRMPPDLLPFLQDVLRQRKQYALRCSRFANEHLTWAGYRHTFFAFLDLFLA